MKAIAKGEGMAAYPWLAHYPKGIDWHAEIPVRPVPALLEDAAKRYGNKPFLEFMGRRFSFVDIHRRARDFAAGLQALGVKKGTRVGLFLPNCPQFVIAYYGILIAGGTVVNFNPLYSQREVKHMVEDARVELMVTLDLKAIYPKLAGIVGQTCLKRIIVSSLCEALPFPKNLLFPFVKKDELATIPRDAQHVRFKALKGTPQPVAIDPKEDIAVLQYTGGTTGLPKAAMLTHANVYANAEQCGLWFGRLEEGKERMLAVLPLFHSFAMTAAMNLPLRKGLLVVLHPKVDVKAVLEDIQNKKITVLPGVPTLFSAINNYKSAGEYDLSSLKICIAGGAPLPVEVKQRFEQKTGCVVVEGYGLSETSPVACVNPVEGVNKPGSIGLPLPGTVIEIIDKDDKTTPMPIGEVGEICIRGPQVMKGYWNKPEETAATLRNGRLHTGDLGKMDVQGYTFVVDRLKEMIIMGGYNIYPRNVEEAIYRHPDVAEAAVVGAAHELRGQIVKAFVVRKPGAALSETELKSFLKNELAPYEVPSKVEFRDSLPKTLIGKIDKKVLVAEESGKK